MKSLTMICLLLILSATTIVAQSQPGRRINAPVQSRDKIQRNFSDASRTKPLAARLGTWPQLSLFAPPLDYNSGGNTTYAVIAGDLNGDGKLDIVVVSVCPNQNCSTRDGSVAVLLGNGDGTFQTAVVYDSGGQDSRSVTIADVNRDGKPDVLVTNMSGSAGVLLGNGDGTLQPAVAYSSGGLSTHSVVVADVNGDGNPDLLLANACSDGNCTKHGTLGVLLGNGDGTFQKAATYDAGGVWTLTVGVADLNGDGKADVIVSDQCIDDNFTSDGVVGVLIGDGNGTFKQVVTYDSGGAISDSVAIGDVNNDGIADVVVTNLCSEVPCKAPSTVGVLLGKRDGTLKPAVPYTTASAGSDSVALTDVDGDGNLDVLVTNTCGGGCDSIGVLLGNGDGTFQPVVTLLPGGLYPNWVTAADVNNDGKPDLIVANQCVSQTNCANGVVSVLMNITSPVVTLAPDQFNFGNQTVGITSSPLISIFTNAGNRPLNVKAIVVTGADSADFVEKNNCPPFLPANGSCKIGATFDPPDTGDRKAAISISDDAPDSPQSISLSGAGVLPAAELSPTSLTFPNQVVFTISPAQQLTLTNSGLGILKITAVKFAGPFGGATNCTNTLASGASCTTNVTFKPKMKGPLSGSIILTDNALGSPQVVPLSGTGTFVQLNPAKVNFGNQPIGTTSAPRYVILSNKGDAPVNISDMSITGTNAGDFSQQNNCSNVVASGAYCKIKLTFTPSGQGGRNAGLVISDDGGGSPQVVPLTGRGTP